MSFTPEDNDFFKGLFSPGQENTDPDQKQPKSHEQNKEQFRATANMLKDYHNILMMAGFSDDQAYKILYMIVERTLNPIGSLFK